MRSKIIHESEHQWILINVVSYNLISSLEDKVHICKYVHYISICKRTDNGHTSHTLNSTRRALVQSVLKIFHTKTNMRS